jgi:hypothetical protein
MARTARRRRGAEVTFVGVDLGSGPDETTMALCDRDGRSFWTTTYAAPQPMPSYDEIARAVVYLRQRLGPDALTLTLEFPYCCPACHARRREDIETAFAGGVVYERETR